MAQNKNAQITYKRGKIGITGSDTFTKVLILIDLITARLFWIALLLKVLFAMPEAGWLPLLLQCLRGIGKYLLVLFIALVPLLMFLSG